MMLGKPFVLILFVTVGRVGATEWSLVNIIRHGERTDNTSDIHLSYHGKWRAEYIARCASKQTPSLAFPLGPPTHLLASLRPLKSVRPYETLKPLSDSLKVELENDIGMADVEKFEHFVQGLPAGATAMVAWQHWWITWLLKAVYPNAPGYPDFCPYSQWSDLPEYTHARCYDILFQLVIKRDHAEDPWHVTAFSMMNMGFDGKEGAECMSAFGEDTNPTKWKQAPAPKGSVHLQPSYEKQCDPWCDPDVHLPGKSPSHCYASSCQRCDWCAGQPGNPPPPPTALFATAMLAAAPSELDALDDSFDGGSKQPAAVPVGAAGGAMLVLATIGTVGVLALAIKAGAIVHRTALHHAPLLQDESTQFWERAASRPELEEKDTVPYVAA